MGVSFWQLPPCACLFALVQDPSPNDPSQPTKAPIIAAKPQPRTTPHSAGGTPHLDVIRAADDARAGVLVAHHPERQPPPVGLHLGEGLLKAGLLGGLGVRAGVVVLVVVLV